MRQITRSYGAIILAGITLVLSFAAYWLPLPQDNKSILFPVLITFIPALVALALAAIEGDGALRALLATVSRGSPKWLLISALVGVGMQLAISAMALVLGMVSTLEINTTPLILALAPATLLFALGEEIGWRGYAVRKLLDGGHSPLFASVITGFPWALVHLSLFLPGMMFVGRPVVAQIIPIVGFAFLHTWVFARAGKSVVAPVLMHGLFNAFGALINSGLAANEATYIGGAVLTAAAVIVVAVTPKWWTSGRN